MGQVPSAHFVVPFGRGGAADRAARAFVRALERSLPAVGEIEVQNVPGEGGAAGVRRANALAARVGEAVFLLGTPTTHVLLAARLGAQAAPAPRFAPLIGLGSAPNVLAVSPRLGIGAVAALVERARREPLAYASAGAGQTIHLCTELFCARAGIAMAHRSCEAGSASAYAELAAGRAHVYFDNLLGCREALARGEAIALAISSARRSALLPGVPTLEELGFEGHALDVWFGVFGTGIDPGLRKRAESTARNEALARELEALGLDGGPVPPAALADEIRRSAAAWTEALDIARKRGETD